MCGIAGAITWQSDRSARLDTFDIDRLAYRGPDARIQVRSADLSAPPQGMAWHLAHARLSILDLSASANQPMCTADGRYWIVYNGELYNNIALRRELEGLGHRFRTGHSDTETLLLACVQWGRHCLERLNGMFAFVFVDNRECNVFAARDRMGIKPFYYRYDDGVFTFASEPKAFTGKRTVDRRQLLSFFQFHQTEGTATFYEGINKLPAAHYLELGPGTSPVPQPYWHPLGESGRPRSLAHAAGAMELLAESVDLQMVADVTVGTYLSGGLDSSVITALASRKGRIKTFSIGFDASLPGHTNELPYAEQVARHLGTDHHALAITPAQYLEAQQRAFLLLDEPIADSACGPLLLLSELARAEGVTVCLSGEGSDEIFIGYRQWHDAYRVARFMRALPRPLLRGYLAMGAPVLGRRKPEWVAWMERHIAGRQILWGGIDKLGRMAERGRLFSPEYLAEARDPYEAVSKHMDGPTGADLLQRLASFDLLFRLPDNLLARVDRMAMAASVEARVPYLDHRLVECGMQLKLDLLIGKAGEKLALKEFAKTMLPPAIINRPKVGFNIPMSAVLTNQEALKQRELILAMDDALRIYSGPFRKQLAEGRVTGPELWPHFALANWWAHHVLAGGGK